MTHPSDESTEIFDGLVSTSYSQLWLVSGTEADLSDPLPTFAGQSNGLCGGSVPGMVFLITGTHTGDIPVRIELLTARPELGDWQEVVEVSFTPTGPTVGLYGWAEGASVIFTLADSSYRLRWSASGMDEGKAQDVADENHPAPDHYLISLWPAAPSPDAVLRRTSATAGAWHDSGFPR